MTSSIPKALALLVAVGGVTALVAHAGCAADAKSPENAPAATSAAAPETAPPKAEAAPDAAPSIAPQKKARFFPATKAGPVLQNEGE